MSLPHTKVTWVTDQARALLPRVDTVVFDIDGVLLDVSQSIRAVNIAALPATLNLLPGWENCPNDLLTSPEVEQFKTAGGFNDDLDLAAALLLLFLFKAARYGSRDAVVLHPLWPTIAEFTDEITWRGGWLHSAEAFLYEQARPAEAEQMRAAFDVELAHRVFLELRFGDSCREIYGFAPKYFPGAGNVDLDVPLLDVALLPPNKTLAVLTGRTLEEARVGLRSAGIEDRILLPENGVTSDEGFHKPRPGGLLELVARKLPNTHVTLYIGDAIDDLRTVLNFRALPDAPNDITVLSAQVLTGTAGQQNAQNAARLFAEADICASDVNAVLLLLMDTAPLPPCPPIRGGSDKDCRHCQMVR